MKNKVIALVFCFLIPASVICGCGNYTEKAEVTIRSINLELLHSIVLEYTVSTKKEPHLYDAIAWYADSKNQKIEPQYLMVPPRKDDKEWLPNYLKDQDVFYRLSEYQLISTDDGWWGIVELKYGRLPGFYLMITKDRKIIQIKKSFLPKQVPETYNP